MYLANNSLTKAHEYIDINLLISKIKHYFRSFKFKTTSFEMFSGLLFHKNGSKSVICPQPFPMTLLTWNDTNYTQKYSKPANLTKVGKPHC